jgi:hypothetical protein
MTKLVMALAEKPQTETVERRVEVPVEKPVLVREKVKSSDAHISDEAEAAFQEALASAADSSAKPAEKKGPDLGGLMKAFGSMMTNDAMKEMIRTQAGMQLDRQYRRLFDYMNLPPEKLAALKKLMAARQEAQMADGMAFMTEGFNKGSLEKRGKAIKETKEAYDKQIAELLGPDDYDAFKQYEDTQMERHEVDQLKYSLADSGEPLTEEQERELVNRFHSARTNSPAMRELLRDDQMPKPEMFSSAGLTNTMALMERQQDQNAEIARSVLSPVQYQQYQRHAEQQRNMQRLGMQMAAQMFGGTTNVSPAVPANVQPIEINAP